MIAVDTNIVVRLLARDEEVQHAEVYRLFSEEVVFIPDTVVLETEWVLRFAYDFSAGDIIKAFRKLFGLDNVHLVNAGSIADALDWHEQGMDFSDAIHLSMSQGVERLLTFDKQFINAAKDLGNCEVAAP